MTAMQFTDYWTRLIGGKELTDSNRMMNAVLIITLAFLVPSTIINIITSLVPPLVINCILIIVVGILYQLSRYRHKYKTSLIVYAIVSYAGLVVTFFYNAGTSGPVLFLFFLTFYVLIAISPQQQHIIWTATHIVIGFALMSLEALYPDLVQGKYLTSGSRFLDLAFTYAISLFFLYLITIHLRRKYDKEKKIASERGEMMVLKSSLIATQSSRLRKIAAVQSHDVRGQVATILGLSELIDSDNPENPHNKEILEGIKQSAHNLDVIIKDIDSLTR